WPWPTKSRWRSWTRAGWVGPGRWTGCGNGWGSGRRSAGSPIVDGWTATRSSGSSSPWSPSGPWSRAASLPRPVGSRSGSPSRAARGLPMTRPTGGWTSCSRRWTRSPPRCSPRSRTCSNLDLDIVFVDTTSTYWEVDGADQVADLADSVDDDGVTRPVEQANRAFGHSKDFRTDLPQVVIAMAVTRDGTPIRCWTFPGNENDTAIIRKVKDDLAGWNLHRMVWVADRGVGSAANRAYLTRGGGHYIHAEKLRHTNAEAAAALARPGRYATVAGNLRVKEI